MRCNETMITGQTLRDAILSGANNIANQRTRVDLSLIHISEPTRH